MKVDNEHAQDEPATAPGPGEFRKLITLFLPSAGPFFEAEDYEAGKTEEELKAFWFKHRAAILTRYQAEEGGNPWPVEKWEGENAD